MGYFPNMALRQFGGDQHVTRFSNLFVINYDYGLYDIDTVIKDCKFGFWQECRSTIDYPTCLGDNYEWSIVEFREWRANRDLCFIVDLFDPRLLVDILRDYALELEVRVKSTLRDLRECLIKAIRIGIATRSFLMLQ